MSVLGTLSRLWELYGRITFVQKDSLEISVMMALTVNLGRLRASKNIHDNAKKMLEESIGSLYMMGYPSTQLLVTNLLKGKKYLDRRILVACSIGTFMEILEELL